MKITCRLNIEDKNIEKLVKSINPENNPMGAKGNQTITFSLEKDKVLYYFNNYDKIATLRLTLEDLLSHLSFSKTINETVQKDKEK